MLVLDHLFEIAIRGGDDSDIEGVPFVSADTLQGVALQDPEQLRLQRQRHIADLVQKEGAAVCQFKFSRFTVFSRSGKGAFLVAEKFAFKESLRYSAAIDRLEGPVMVRAGLVHSPGKELLAGAAVSPQQDRGAPRSSNLRLFDQVQQRPALTLNLLEGDPLVILIYSGCNPRQPPDILKCFHCPNNLIPDEDGGGAVEELQLNTVDVYFDLFVDNLDPLQQRFRKRGLGEKIGDGFADEGFAAVVEEPFDNIVHEGDLPPGIHGDDPFADGIDDRFQVFFVAGNLLHDLQKLGATGDELAHAGHKIEVVALSRDQLLFLMFVKAQ